MNAAVDAGDVTKLSVWTIVIVVAIGLLLSLVLTALIARVVIAVVVIVLAVVVWQQRSSVEHKIDQQKCSFTFFGMHLDVPDSLRRHCD
jgi:membrane protein implicated in regulation of membrane protease activity